MFVAKLLSLLLVDLIMTVCCENNRKECSGLLKQLFKFPRCCLSSEYRPTTCRFPYVLTDVHACACVCFREYRPQEINKICTHEE